MALSYKSRRRWSLVILLVGLPIYVVASISLLSVFERPSIFLELFTYFLFCYLDWFYNP